MKILFKSLFSLIIISAVHCEKPLSASELLDIKDQIKIVDFRGQDAHDLDGFIEKSLPIPDQMDDKTENILR